jgi:hypothetical protein
MKPPTPTLRQQAEAVEVAALNLQGHINNLVGLVNKGRRPQLELDVCRLRYPALFAASRTLMALATSAPTQEGCSETH